MEQRGNMKQLCTNILHIFILGTTLVNSSEARIPIQLLKFLGTSLCKVSAREIHLQDDQLNIGPYGSISPMYIAPRGEPSPPRQQPPGSPPLGILHNAPGPSPPGYIVRPPNIAPSSRGHVANPPKHVPVAPFFQPPAVYRPPPPPGKAVWCVAKPAVPDSIMQAALDYACGSGADCKPISPNGPCYSPNTLLGHASYAFNNYWQKKKSVGATCDFGGTAMLVTVNPSTSRCEFNNA